MYSSRGSDEERLEALFQAFRGACQPPEPSANFMPNLWRRIDEREKFSFSFGRMASAFVTAALALSMALGIYLAQPVTVNAGYYSQSYVEALDADAEETGDSIEPVRYEVPLNL